MYLPDYFREDRPDVLLDFMRAHPLAMVVSMQAGCPSVDHLPLLLDASVPTSLRLRGHCARANPLVARVPDAASVLVVFGGADHYITPAWYAQKAIDGRVVPTWNYSTVHVHGILHWVTDALAVRSLVTDLTDEHEKGRAHAWAVTDAPEDYVASMLKPIVGFEIKITAMVGKFKNSQNKNEADRVGIAKGLSQSGLSEAAVDELLKPRPTF